MSRAVYPVMWNELKFRYSDNRNEYGTCWLAALKLLFGKDYNKIMKDEVLKEYLTKDQAELNRPTNFYAWAINSDKFRHAQLDEDLSNEEGIMSIQAKNLDGSLCNHTVYFKNGEYYDDYMSFHVLSDIRVINIIVRAKK